MAQGLQSLSLIVAGQVIRGVCYASPDQFVGRQAPLSPIPPERMGLQGEYDHYGLAKRIQARFKERLGRVAAAKVMVKQRGGAIILSGQVESQGLLEELITLAIKADGAAQVEVYDMQVNSLTAVSHSVFQVA